MQVLGMAYRQIKKRPTNLVDRFNFYSNVSN